MTYKFFFDLVTKSLFITLLSLVVGFVPNAMASDVTLAAFMKGAKYSRIMDIQFEDKNDKEQVIVVTSHLDSNPIKFMIVFKGNRCTGKAIHSEGTGHFNLQCVDGAKLKSSFQCFSYDFCLMPGRHSNLGKFKLFFKPKYKKMSIEAIRDFMGVVSTATNSEAKAPANQSSSGNLSANPTVAAIPNNSSSDASTVSNDTQMPLITITQSFADGRKGIIKGIVKDKIQVAEVLINGEAVNLAKDGSFEWSGFVPNNGKDITIEAINTSGVSTSKVIRLERGMIQKSGTLFFPDLNPLIGKKVKPNENALALIVGISIYDRTNAPAIFADNDAHYFHDYASLKMGIPESNITTMVNTDAEQADVLLAVKQWLSRAVKQNQSDVYVFFAGHGLASDDGQQMYLLPHDGAPELLEKTAILRANLFDDIASSNPRSVTVFLDTCYSGTTRGTDMLIASRPIAIKAKPQMLPDNFTVLTAAAGDQTAKPLEEAKHGMFSYFLMKGMEGDADANQDNQITAGELHAYVQENVVQQSSGSQTPELQGDAERVLVQFE